MNETNDGQIQKTLSYDDKVIKKIAGISAYNVPGLITMSGGLLGNLTDKLRGGEKPRALTPK